jgi:DNA polymerase-1
MLRIRDTLAGEEIAFHYCQSRADLKECLEWFRAHKWLAIDTESTGLNCYKPGWELRTVQIGNAYDCYVIPARYRLFIASVMASDVKWIAHNGPHDIRSIDAHLGYETGVVCAGETYLPAHHLDSRNRKEGGVGHGLKELAIALVDPQAGKWEKHLKAEFKKIRVPLVGQIYKSGPRKGQDKSRAAHLDEGWALIDPTNSIYIAYAAADPILAYRVWTALQPVVSEFLDLYRHDHRVQMACDRLQRRAIRLDSLYAERLSSAYLRRATRAMEVAAEFGCSNINSTAQLAKTILRLGGKLTARTATGKYKVDSATMRKLRNTDNVPLSDFLRNVLLAKQILKRRESYTEQMLAEMSDAGRIHPSINSLGARTARMSVSRPPLQQLPTKDRAEDE